jgi:peroxin-4
MTGEICLDILKNHWTPAWSLSLACQALLVLLSNPEPSSPLNCDAGNLLRCKDFRGFSSLSKIFQNY